jgi:hypothetical protein
MAKQKIKADLEVDGTVSAANGTTSTHLVNKGQLDTKQDSLFSGNNIKTINGSSVLGSGNLVVNTSLHYKVYTALLSQSGNNAPIATVLQNTLGGTVVWSRIGFGGYNGTLSGAFTTNKTTVSISNGWQNGIYNIRAGVPDLNYVVVGTFIDTTNTDSLLDNTTTSIEIRVYN